MSESPLPFDQTIWSEVRRLRRRQAAALVLWAVEGLTHAEIGEALGCSAETARTHVRRAKDALARLESLTSQIRAALHSG